MGRERKKYNVPGKGSKRGCLCRDGTYSKKCCKDDDYMAQGIGYIGGRGESE